MPKFTRIAIMLAAITLSGCGSMIGSLVQDAFTTQPMPQMAPLYRPEQPYSYTPTTRR